MKSLTLTCFGLLSVFGSTVWAQEFSRFSYGIGAGFTTPVGGTGRIADTGWNIRGNGGYNFNQRFAVDFNVGYDAMGVNSATLSNIGTPGGELSVFSFTLDPKIHLTPHSKMDLYAFGGGGYFRQEEEFTQPSTNANPGYYPVLGYYPGFTNGGGVVGNYSVNKAGIDAGLGVGIKSLGSGKIFAEARYERIFLTNGYHSDFVPVTFGYRW